MMVRAIAKLAKAILRGDFMDFSIVEGGVIGRRGKHLAPATWKSKRVGGVNRIAQSGKSGLVAGAENRGLWEWQAGPPFPGFGKGANA
jgi:hypothetical protein